MNHKKTPSMNKSIQQIVVGQTPNLPQPVSEHHTFSTPKMEGGGFTHNSMRLASSYSFIVFGVQCWMRKIEKRPARRRHSCPVTRMRRRRRRTSAPCTSRGGWVRAGAAAPQPRYSECRCSPAVQRPTVCESPESETGRKGSC